MAKQDIDIGVEGNDGTGDSIRESFRKVNENFTELYAVFGKGGQISLTDLSDTPNNYEDQENKIIAVKQDGSGVNFLEFASDNALLGTTDTIGFDYSIDGKLIIRQLSSKVSNDETPTLGGPLNASSFPIANIDISQDAIDVFNATYGTNFSTDALVINKAFADRNYQQKDVAGGGLRIGDEPSDISQYVLSTEDIQFARLRIPDHGLTQAFNAAPFIFQSSGTDPFGVTSGTTYYIRVFDQNSIQLFYTEDEALTESSPILLSGGTGTFTITDAAYDDELQGNWLDNVALPRKSIVRRQGDDMVGALNLHDHPGDLEGFGLPNGPDDLQAATKLYVDSVASTSQVNLYVSTSGTDRQTRTPVGLEGRSAAYAYRTVNAAARKAEELILSAPFEPGPYMQTMTFNNGEGISEVATAGVDSPTVGRNDARQLVLANKEFIAKEVTAYIDATYPDFAGTYNVETCQRDVGYILEAVTLDSLLGNNANYLSRWAGIRYYSSPSAQKAIGAQRIETIAGIEYAKELTVNYVLKNVAVPTTYQDRVEQTIDETQIPDVLADNTISDRFDTVLEVIDVGVLDAPTVVDGTSVYKINVGNGNTGFIDQANPENTDIIPGKVVRGKDSGAIGRIIDYKYEAGPRAVSLAETDEIEVQLLEPIEFIPGEDLEYGNVVRETQISIRIESGVYEEDYPIRVPANVSVKGDEFRRVIIRPKKRISQSRYANTFFYRDAEFDGLVLGKTNIETFTIESPADVNRAAGTYTVTAQDYTTNKFGRDAIFEVTIDSNGAVTDVTLTNNGDQFQINELIELSDDGLGGGGAPDVVLKVTKVPNGIEYVNPLTNNVDGYFGYHYLDQPDKLKNTGSGYTNIGNWEKAALALIDNREFIQEQVVEYIDTTYPALVGNYNRTKCSRDAGLVVDAIVKDLRNGGNEFALEAQGEYYAGAVEVGTENETVAGLEHILTIASSLFENQTPTIFDTTGGNLNYPAPDLFNGDVNPDHWITDKLYRVGNVTRFFIGGIYRYYQCKLEHRSTEFTSAEVSRNWTEVPGPESTVENLIGTVTFAFDADYNPPLRNDQMDAFLMNDATILRNMTVQGHGGFMLVLDPEGQVLTKSPYVQTGSSFSQSLNKQAFRGGLFVDAFTGNSAVQVVEKVDSSPYRLKIQSLGSPTEPQGLYVRKPETPSAFYVDGKRFQINAVTNYDPNFGTAEIILSPDSNDGNGFTGTTSQLITGIDLDSVGTFDYNQAKCERDTQLVLTGVAYDTVLGSNYNSVVNGLAYRRASGQEVIDNQLTETVNALTVGKTETLSLEAVAADAGATSAAGAGWDEVIDILQNGVANADALVFTDPGLDSNKLNARVLLQLNQNYISGQLASFVNTNYPSLVYDQSKFQLDINYIVDALSYDVQYGGNTAIITQARAYLDNAILDIEDTAIISAVLSEFDTVAQAVIDESAVGQTTNGSPASATEQAEISSALSILANTVGVGSDTALPTEIYPDTSWASTPLNTAKDSILVNTALIVHRVIQSIPAPLPITLQTAGNRSILGNDFTQVNDLGYGLVAANGALSEMVSMFTYYCYASYYSKNGAEIRSLTGSSCYGEFGLVAEGSDPNEIPDAVFLAEDMTQPALSFTAEAILKIAGSISLTAGETITQATSGASGDVAIGTTGNTIFLSNISGAFNTTNELTGSVSGALGATSVPYAINNNGYTNKLETLSLHAFDMKDIPSSRSELDIYHPARPAFARYEVANVEDIGVVVGQFELINSIIPAVTVAADGGATGAIFNINTSISENYTVEITASGSNYTIGDTISVDGANLGGATSTNDAVIEVTAIDDNGGITGVTVTGTIAITDATPVYNGRVYRLNFSTSDASFSQDGLLEEVLWGQNINYRRNAVHKIGDIAAPDVLSIRPSTAILFKEDPSTVYRSISFLTSDSLGNDLGSDESLAGFDSTYDYIRLLVDITNAGSTDLAGTGTTKGGTAGDVRIAVQPVLDDNEINRLNNNLRTPEGTRPIGWTPSSLVEAPILTWNGKKHYVFNARGVKTLLGVETEVPYAEDVEYAIVDIAEVGDEINQTPTTGLAGPVILGNEVITLRAGLKAGALADVTINISTCRATGHDFLDVGTGGFNTSNYPNVIFGLPREADQAKEVQERTKGRVFYVSTDQNGIFRVGRFFSVDQGTGTVTFAASLALSDVDGLGFKRGVVVTEFSTDTAMTDNASDSVPTESAVRGYVNRRLGYDVNGAPIANILGPGVLAPNGAVPMTGDLNAASNTITNLAGPTSNSDAATKAYVDTSQGNSDELGEMRDVYINGIDKDQVLVSSGYKKIVLSGDSLVNGPYGDGDVMTGSFTGATGTIVESYSSIGFEGSLINIVYTPTSVTDFSTSDVAIVSGGAQAQIIDGPMDEWVNGVWSAASDVEFTSTRQANNTELDIQIKPDTIVNADVNANAGIAQSKLNMEAATTRSNANNISQGDLGLASFDSAVFSTTDGWVSINDGQLPLNKIQRISDGTVLGNFSGDSSDNDIDALPFSTVVSEGGGLSDDDFLTIISDLADPGQALIKTGAGTYSTSNVSVTGEGNSVVKTNTNGSIQVNSLILGGDTSYEVLTLDTTTLVFKTPAQGTILTAAGGSSSVAPDISIPGSVSVGGTDTTESVLQANSPLNGESAFGSDWIYSSFIEAPGEKGVRSTGLSIGANTGKTAQGEVGTVVASLTGSVTPFIFSSAGVRPDTDNQYNIGTNTRKYNTVYATLFNGTALEAYYADLAENYVADEAYEPGTVLVFGGDEELTITTTKGDHRIAGVVSTEPATLMNSMLTGDTVVPLALQGRVPCKVLGKVQKGDILVTSAIPGYAMVDNDAKAGRIIGKSLENKNNDSKGVIEVVVGKH